MTTTDDLPRWSVTDLHESFDSRSFIDAMERTGADASRLEALFEQHGIRAVEARAATADDGVAADAVVAALNDFHAHSELLEAYIYATTSTNSFDERAQALMAETARHHSSKSTGSPPWLRMACMRSRAGMAP